MSQSCQSWPTIRRVSCHCHWDLYTSTLSWIRWSLLSSYRLKTMGTAETVFSYCVGGLALISTISSMLFYCRLYLPTTQLRLLDEILVETKDIYRKANEERLLPSKVSIDAQMRLRKYDDESDTLREVVYRARSNIDAIRTLFRGHTRRIMRLVDKVGDLRAYLMTVSQKEKARRVLESRTSGVVLCPQVEGTLECHTTVCLDDCGDPGFPSGSFVSEPVSQDHPRSMGADQRPDDYALPDSTAPVLSPPLCDDTCRIQTCCFCSLLKWWTRGSSAAQTSLPTFVAPEGDQCSSGPNANSSSRASTLVDKPPQKSTSCPRSLLNNRVSVYVWTFLGRQTDVVHKISKDEDDTPLPRHDSAATLTV